MIYKNISYLVDYFPKISIFDKIINTNNYLYHKKVINVAISYYWQ